jgi:hypothetical protein
LLVARVLALPAAAPNGGTVIMTAVLLLLVVIARLRSGQRLVAVLVTQQLRAQAAAVARFAALLAAEVREVERLPRQLARLHLA